jgi:divalent metal cation (Fe/Co/Zn/Cd) transporter
MHAVMEWLGSLGAGVVLLVISLGSLAAAIAAGYYAFKFTNKTWVAWVAGILAFVIIALILAPTYEAVKRVGCRGPDYQACMDGEDER